MDENKFTSGAVDREFSPDDANNLTNLGLVEPEAEQAARPDDDRAVDTQAEQAAGPDEPQAVDPEAEQAARPDEPQAVDCKDSPKLSTATKHGGANCEDLPDDTAATAVDLSTLPAGDGAPPAADAEQWTSKCFHSAMHSIASLLERVV